MGRPLTALPTSSAAMRAASTDPRPVALASGPFKSVMTPTLIGCSEICESAGPATPAATAKFRHNARGSLNMDIANSSPSLNGYSPQHLVRFASSRFYVAEARTVLHGPKLIAPPILAPKLRRQHCIGSNEYFDRG